MLRLQFIARNWIIYSNPFCRLDGMMAGALLAILVRKSGFAPARLLKVAWGLFLIAVPLAITTAAYGVIWLAFSMGVVASASFLHLAVVRANRGVHDIAYNS